jgi:hypothetical protein
MARGALGHPLYLVRRGLLVFMFITLFVQVLNINEPPAPQDYDITVSETTALNTVILASIPGNDPDAGTVLT